MTLLHTIGSAANGGAETYFTALVGALARGGFTQAAVMRAHLGREAALQALGVATSVQPFAKHFDFSTPSAIAGMARQHGAKVWYRPG